MNQNYDAIFSQADDGNLGDFFKFQTPGDKISGTYIDLQEGIDGFQNEQYIVTLLREGVKHRIGIRKNHEILIDQLRPVRFGQIIGFIFVEERPSTRGANSKIINLKQSASLVDEAWIKSKLAADAIYGIAPEASLRPAQFRGAAPATVVPAADDVPFGPSPVAAAPAPVATPAASPSAPNPVLDTIRNLAISKGVGTAEQPKDQLDAAIKALTGYDLTEGNTTEIIVKLSAIGA